MIPDFQPAQLLSSGEQSYDLDSLESTAAFAHALANALPPNRTVTLEGPLGSGKTTLVRAMARSWGITDPVTSPTFNLMNLYQGTRQLVHIDAYRLGSPDAWEELMVEDFLHSPWCIAIEWASRLPPIWPGPTWRIILGKYSPSLHRVHLQPAEEDLIP